MNVHIQSRSMNYSMASGISFLTAEKLLLYSRHSKPCLANRGKCISCQGYRRGGGYGRYTDGREFRDFFQGTVILILPFTPVYPRKPWSLEVFNHLPRFCKFFPTFCSLSCKRLFGLRDKQLGLDGDFRNLCNIPKKSEHMVSSQQHPICLAADPKLWEEGVRTAAQVAELARQFASRTAQSSEKFTQEVESIPQFLAVDLEEKDRQYHLLADVPGLQKSDLKVNSSISENFPEQGDSCSFSSDDGSEMTWQSLMKAEKFDPWTA